MRGDVILGAVLVAPPHPRSLPIEGREALAEAPVFIVSLPLVGRDQGWGCCALTNAGGDIS